MPLLLLHVFVSFMEKEPRTNICGVFVSFHEVMKLQSFEFGMSDVIAANTQNISPLVFLAYFY